MNLIVILFLLKILLIVIILIKSFRQSTQTKSFNFISHITEVLYSFSSSYSRAMDFDTKEAVALSNLSLSHNKPVKTRTAVYPMAITNIITNTDDLSSSSQPYNNCKNAYFKQSLFYTSLNSFTKPISFAFSTIFKTKGLFKKLLFFTRSLNIPLSSPSNPSNQQSLAITDNRHFQRAQKPYESKYLLKLISIRKVSRTIHHKVRNLDKAILKTRGIRPLESIKEVYGN